MKRFAAIACGAVVLFVFGALAYLNPTDVEFRFSPTQTLRLPLGWLLVLTFVAGAFLVMVLNGLQQLGRLLAGTRERQRIRQAVRVGEWQQSGSTLAWEGEVQRGRALLRKAWRRQPRNSAAALALATSYMDTAEYAAAREVLEKALAENASDPDLRYALGESLRRSGEHGEAIRMLETVRVQHPHAPRAILSLRELYRESERWKEAAAVQEAYLETVSDDARPSEEQRLRDLRYRAALAIEDSGSRAEALGGLLERYRDFAPAAVSLGDALVASNRAAEARSVWERAFKASPELTLVERLLAHPETIRDREKTLALLHKYRQQLDPERLHVLLARTELADNNLEKAAAELSAVGHQKSAEVRRLWAEVYHRRGQHEEAWNLLARLADERANAS